MYVRIDEGRPTKKALTNIDDTTMAPRTQRGNIIYIYSIEYFKYATYLIIFFFFFFPLCSVVLLHHTSRYIQLGAPSFSSVSLQPFFFYYYDHLHISSSSYSGLTVFSFSVHRALLLGRRRCCWCWWLYVGWKALLHAYCHPGCTRTRH